MLLSALTIAVALPALSTTETRETDEQSESAIRRNEIGDLNREAVEAGDFSSSILNLKNA